MWDKDRQQAMDEITRLRAENERLRRWQKRALRVLDNGETACPPGMERGSNCNETFSCCFSCRTEYVGADCSE